MRSFLLIALVIAACGGEEKKAEPAKPAEPPKAVEAPKPPPPPPAAPAASGPYTPDDLAKAAYEKAKAAGADGKTNPKSGDATAIAAGKTKYEQLCSSCHGAAGMGDGVAGAALPQKPAAFTHKERWDATSAGVKHWIIQNGIAGTGMAGFVADEAQAWEVLAYVETLAAAAPAAPAAAPAAPAAAPTAIGGAAPPTSVGGSGPPTSIGGGEAPKAGAAKPGDGAKTGGGR